ncbi:MAG: hypothetical protein QM753_10760 [Thermomicrobiales bacterium]
MRVVRGLMALVAAMLLATVPIGVGWSSAAAETPPTLPGVPASVTVQAWLTFDLEGDYQWQSTKLQAGSSSIGTIQVHHGFLIATDSAVEVSDPAFGIRQVPAGGAMAMGEGQQIEVTAPAGSSRLMFVELVAKGGAFENEQPDSVKTFTVPKGRYTLAVLAVPGGANAPSAGSVVAKAAAPAIAVYPEGSTATPGATSGNPYWLVALFPAV